LESILNITNLQLSKTASEAAAIVNTDFMHDVI